VPTPAQTPAVVPERDAAALATLEAERDRVIQSLATHYAYDRLSLEAFEERLERAYRALSAPQLAALLADLPRTTAEELAAASPALRAPAASVPDRGFAFAVMGGVERKGAWMVPRHLKVVAVMGGAEIDLREARFGPGVTEIDVFALMGGVEILVPPGVRVECSGAAMAGGFTADTSDVGTLSPTAPVVRLSGMAFFGGVEAQTRFPGESTRDYKRRRREERRQARRR
jgi:hypothetical protein